ncbi:PLP-dependent aminotransferase family protein [Roseiterribacter gracilis]|uniref:GntR family transcriptional regulator n=1 Tax=Roseiterribacter gracilis TaxID=2812848 RepID=A0A8S8XGF1_9PROT|nr:GntR family transcriptional regulator [Rhodospirillales bacterium TMPK1]
MDPIFELAITLPPPGSRDRLRALHAQLRAAILDGRLKPDLRLPATRALAESLCVSRNTVVAAYDLLLSEGYLVARAGSGTYVADVLPQMVPPKELRSDAAPDARLSDVARSARPIFRFFPPTDGGFDFRSGYPDASLIPFDIWMRLSARALRAASRRTAAYTAPEGQLELRDAIAKHVSFTRAVACSAEDVVVTAGAQQAFELLARILVTPGKTVVAMEEPNYVPMRISYETAGAVLKTVPVDEEGMIIELLPPDAKVICVTPSHQYPLGVVMSPRRRAALLDFAQANNAVVIEDDYDGEFRFGGRPHAALQTLDRNESVFYIGTFSKSLFPSLRLGFVVVPPWAKPALVRAKQTNDWCAPTMTQDTLAAFISEGHLARHMRKMRKVYGDRRTALLHALAQQAGDLLQPIEGDSGLHLSAHLIPSIDALVIAHQAHERGHRIQALNRFGTSPADEINGFVFGFGLMDARGIERGVETLAQMLRAAIPVQARASSR